MLETARRTTRTLVTTYLGQDAAGRVLAGNIIRGQAEKIRAVVWFSDVAGFTHLSELTEAEGMLALLNDYAEVQVDAIERHGGHVLKFIGDAILAIFPHADDGLACERPVRPGRRRPRAGEPVERKTPVRHTASGASSIAAICSRSSRIRSCQ